MKTHKLKGYLVAPRSGTVTHGLYENYWLGHGASERTVITWSVELHRINLLCLDVPPSEALRADEVGSCRGDDEHQGLYGHQATGADDSEI